MKRVHMIVMTFAALGLVLGACDSKVAQCNKLTKGINTQGGIFKAEQAKLRISAQDIKGSAKSLGHIADVFKKAGDKVAGIKLKDSKLKKFQEQWVSMVKRIAKQFIAAQKALLAKDVPGALKAQKAVIKVGAEESKVVNAINSYCAAK